MERSPLDALGDLRIWDLAAWGTGDRRAAFRRLWDDFRRGTTTASSYRSAILESFAEFAYRYSKKKDDTGRVVSGYLDAVVLTGDIATTGKEDDIILVKEFLTAPSTRKPWHTSDETGDATLKALTIPVGYLPGNHDRFIPTNKAAWTIPGVIEMPRFFEPGGNKFDTVLKMDFLVRPIKRLRRLASPLPAGGELAVYMFIADFSLRDFKDNDYWAGGWIGQGKAYQDVCDTLAEQTLALRKRLPASEVAAVIWACHFPPEFPKTGKSRRFVKDNVFVDAAKKAEVDAVIAGHTHEHLQYKSGDVDVFCCGTTAQYEPTTQQGGRHSSDKEKGNFIQILTINEENGQPRITADTFKYVHDSNGHTGGGPIFPGEADNDLPWKRVDGEWLIYRRKLFPRLLWPRIWKINP
jgi:hypothetical protein